MSRYVAKRLRFRNGERLSVLLQDGIPVHLAVLYINRYRSGAKAANTIHQVCSVLALLYEQLDRQGFDLWAELREGRFPPPPVIDRFAAAAQYKVRDLEEKPAPSKSSRVVSIEKLRFRATAKPVVRESVGTPTHAIRIRYAHAYLKFAAEYAGPLLSPERANRLAQDAERGLRALEAHIPRVSNRDRLGRRVGLSQEQQELLLRIVHPDSPDNPWKFRFVRVRNWLIVVLLLAAGMRRGELLGLQVSDIVPHGSKVLIVRRADAQNDARVHQPNAKTADREVPIAPSVLRALSSFIANERRSLKAARRIPQVFTSDEGAALSLSSLSQIFVDIRTACPQLPPNLTSHVMRHTWNERFSEQAEAMELTGPQEEGIRNTLQGWTHNSKTAARYTRRFTERKGRDVALGLQERLERGLNESE